MPLLRTTEKIFIGYSRPQLAQKEVAERIIGEINAANRHKHIQLYVCEYRQLVNDSIPLQQGIDRVIEECDLAILLFGDEVGAGLAYETQYSFDLFRTGRIYKILPYVFVSGDRRPGAGGGISRATDVEHFYNSRGVEYYQIENPDTFGMRLRQHIEIWLAEEERIVERQRDFLKRGLLRHFAIEDVAFNDQIIAIHRRDRDNPGATEETAAAYQCYVDAGEGQLLREEPVDYYLIARHLRDAALRDLPEVVSRTEFINPIHQFLAALLRRDTDDVRDRVTATYVRWLSSRFDVSERARSFAAFQLGIIQARSAAKALLDTARNRGELNSVRHYAIYALGMLKQRSMIIPLMDVHADETDHIIRDALTNSILYMMGVTE
jgi:hypothetical protein